MGAIHEEQRQIRKLQLSGGSTFILSLPKTWVEDLNLKGGDSVILTKNSNKSVTVSSNIENQHQSRSNATITIGQKDPPESLRRKIIATYLGGYKTIYIKSKGVRILANHARTVRDLVRKSMIGTEIVESSSEYITIQILTRLPELSFNTALKRMYLMAVNMHKEAAGSLAESDVSHADEIVQMDDEVDRFSLYMRRNLVLAVQNANILREMGLDDPADCLGYRAVISRIERIADHAVLIAKRVKFIEGKIDSKVMKKISNLSLEAVNVFEEAILALEKKNYEKAEHVAEKVNDIVKNEKEIMSTIKESARNSTVTKFVLEDIRRVAEYSSDIAEVAIDGNINEVITET